MATVPPEDLVFVDESALTITMTRLYARAPKGERAYGSAPKNWDKSVSVVGALSRQGLLAAMSIQGSVNREVFLVYLRRVLAPMLWPGAVVVMDNLAVHKAREVEAVVEAVGGRVVYLPPYSPDLSPIEPCWSKLKAYLRKRAARTYEALDEALSAGIETISSRDAMGWFRHCGYRPPLT